MPADIISLGLLATLAPPDAAGLGRPAIVSTIAVPAHDASPLPGDLLSHMRADYEGLDEPSARAEGGLPRLRRMGVMVDYRPLEERGLHLSVGLRSSARKALSRAMRISSVVYAPMPAGAVAYRSNYKLREAAMTLGWRLPVAQGAVVDMEAGTTLGQNNRRATAASIAEPRLSSGSWARVGAVAQVAFALKL
jgi:hypothetical protein